jgi:hypothetical protein
LLSRDLVSQLDRAERDIAYNRTGDAALHYGSEPKGPEPTP